MTGLAAANPFLLCNPMVCGSLISEWRRYEVGGDRGCVLTNKSELFSYSCATVPLEARHRNRRTEISLTFVGDSLLVSRVAAGLTHRQSEPRTGGSA